MIDQAMVRKLAKAAHIDLAHEELDRIAAQMTDILEQIAPIANVAEAHVAASAGAHADGRAADGADDPDNAVSDDVTAFLFDHPQPLRTDEPRPDPLNGTLSRFAPEVREGFFTVPRLSPHGDNAS